MRRRGHLLLILAVLLAGLAVLAPAGQAQQCEWDEEGNYECDQSGQPTIVIRNEAPDQEDDDEPWWAKPSVEVGLAVVGLVGSASAGTYAALRVRQRRERLRDLLQRIDAAFRAHKTDPEQGIPELIALRTEVHQDHHEGRLDDGRFLELSDRVGAHIVRLRMLQVDRAHPDLPESVRSELRHVLSDGNLSHDDAGHVLERADHLGYAGVEALGTVLNGWVEQDAEPSTTR